MSISELINCLGLQPDNYFVGPNKNITKQVTAYYPQFDEEDSLIKNFKNNHVEILDNGAKYLNSSSVFYESFMSTSQVAVDGKLVTMWELQRHTGKMLDWLYGFEGLKLVRRQHDYYQAFDDAMLHELLNNIYIKLEKMLDGHVEHMSKLFSLIIAAEYVDSDKMVDLAVNHTDEEIQHFIIGFKEVKKFKIPVLDYKELFNKI